jgi:hypothetical protein
MAKGRIAKLKTRIDALIAEEASLTQRVAQVVSVAPSAVDVAEWARCWRSAYYRNRKRCLV